MNKNYDHIVIGAGALGTATAYWLARSGATNVLVLEQFDLGHTNGASEDHSRIIRHSYDSITYTSLTRDMFETWREVEHESGVSLITTTGGLDLAVDGSPCVEELAKIRSALDPVSIEYEDLTASEIRRRWPQWRIDDDVTGIYQADAGILDIRHACATHIALARGRGVQFEPNTTVTDLAPDEDKVVVTTERGTFTAGNVVV